ncbi:MAG: hypothetical protein IBX40_12040, partial [Methanosarcinales archaeon]|nr:hypothetical protein [Methanosarcinales archaeon]
MTGKPFHSTANLKFAFYSISTDLGAKPAPKHLEPIDYDRWSELHWKAQLEDNLT